MNHPLPSDLISYSRQALSELEADPIHEHLESCSECHDSVAAMEAESVGEFLQVPTKSVVECVANSFADEIQCRRMVDAICDERFDHSTALENLPRIIGNYELQSRIGEGGMGVVYRATHTRLKRDVAVKLLRVNRLGNPRAIDRFQREMIAAGRLNHPNIVLVLDAGEEDGTHYMVMEHLKGLDLSKLIRKAPLSIANVCEIMRQAALGVHEAHEKQLIHRDIKPSNLFLTQPDSGQDGPTVKLLDLGLAMLGGGVNPVSELSLSGQVLGTLAYMAPEQVLDSSEVDQRADIYALGATMYKLLGGHAPLDVESPKELNQGLLAWLKGTTPSVKTKRNDLPNNLAAIVDQALSKNPNDRFQSAAIMAGRLEPFCAGADLASLLENIAAGTGTKSNEVGRLTGDSTVVSRSKKRRVNAVVACLATAVAIALSMAFAVGWLMPKTPDAINFGPAAKVSELNTPSIDEVSSISHDGLRVVLQSNRVDSDIQFHSRRYQLYTASRPTTKAIFSHPDSIELAEVNESSFSVRSGLISPNQLELFYFSHDNDVGGRKTFFRSVRKRTNDSFLAGPMLEEASLVPWGSGCYHSPQWMSPDGLRLYYTFENMNPNNPGAGDRKLYLIQRNSLDENFGEPSDVFFADLNKHKASSACLSSNELELFFSSDRPGGRGESDIWYASRDNIDQPFANPINVRAVNTSEIETAPKLFGDSLYFSRGSDNDRDVFMTERKSAGHEELADSIVAPKYGVSTPVDELNSDCLDAVCHISHDGLRMVIQSTRDDVMQRRNQLFYASRPHQNAPFSKPNPFVFSKINASGYNAGSAVVSTNQLEVFYLVGSDPNGCESFLRSTRKNVTDVFPEGEMVREASLAHAGEDCFHSPRWISCDSLRLYFALTKKDPGSPLSGPVSTSNYVIERKSTTSKFGRPADAIFRNIQFSYWIIFSLSSDELELYFSAASPTDPSQYDICYARRNHLSEPFGKPVVVNSLANAHKHISGPHLCCDSLYFNQGSNNELDIYFASRIPVEDTKPAR